MLSGRAKAAAFAALFCSAAAPVPHIPPADRLLDKVRARALEYSRSLPNFICTEVVRRSIDLTRPKIRRLLDVLTFTVSYGPEGEHRQLILVDGATTSQPENTIGGLRNLGEFGGMLAEIFDPATEASFVWKSWATLRGRPAAVFLYVVDRSRSQYRLSHDARKAPRSTVVGIRGTLTVDRETGQVLQLLYQAADIPKDFPLQYSSTIVEYDFSTVAGKQYLLPIRSATETRSTVLKAHNFVEFSNYRRFSADSTVQFGDLAR